MFVNSRYDVNSDKKLDIDELKVMMEKLGVPQTHLGNEWEEFEKKKNFKIFIYLALKEMIKELDEDMDSKINFREVCSLVLK